MSAESADSRAESEYDRDVVIVGGGPTGSSAAVFTARYGLDTLVFDRGNAALKRCAYLENYLGFPAGIGIDVFYDLMAAQVEETGGEIVADMVTSVERTDDGTGFVVETQDDRRITAAFVVAAAWYDGEYLRPLGGDELFEEHEHHGDVHEHFDPEYPDEDGRTPIDGLYVAAPCGNRNDQAIISAGHGAHVARCLLEDLRHEVGFTGGVAPHYDWLRRDSEFSGEWAERDRWREWFDNEVADDHDLHEDRLEELRERYIDRAFETRVSDDEVAVRSRDGLRQLVETIGIERVLDAIDDERIQAYTSNCDE